MLQATTDNIVLTSSTVQVLANGYGYRSDDYSENEVIKSNVQVLDHEINDLENDDIIDFVEDHYDLPQAVVRDKDEYVERDANGYVIQEDLARQIDARVKSILHTDSYDLIWLCSSVQDVLSSDYAETKDSVYKYELPENGKDFAVISDLGHQGCLIAYAY